MQIQYGNPIQSEEGLRVLASVNASLSLWCVFAKNAPFVTHTAIERGVGETEKDYALRRYTESKSLFESLLEKKITNLLSVYDANQLHNFEITISEREVEAAR